MYASKYNNTISDGNLCTFVTSKADFASEVVFHEVVSQKGCSTAHSLVL
jgi:hypothetical protein